jgi:hypothetical protein
MAMDDYEKFEEDSKKIRCANEQLLKEFGAALKLSGLSEKTINGHLSNIEFYVNDYLLYDDVSRQLLCPVWRQL